MSGQVIAALIAVGTATLAALAKAFGKVVAKWVNLATDRILDKNTVEHDRTTKTLERIEAKVDDQSDILLSHLSWHITKKESAA